tara:strand:+ start:70 stop:390 length:321 start_codon:yes stop_codon:yes gene_type:complete
MSETLRSDRNDFPERYHEYAIKDLVADPPGTLGTGDLEKLKKNIQEKGMIYPIVVRSNEENRPDKLYVQVGRQRVWIAKELGYTHISAYHSPFEDVNFGNRLQWKV